jgi:hypothetical protein
MRCKLFFYLAAFATFFVSCEKNKNDKVEPLENIIVGKTDYAGCLYDKYEPGLIYTVDIDLNDSVNNQDGVGFEYRVNGSLDIYKYHQYEEKIIHKFLTFGGGKENIPRMAENDTISRIFQYGDTLGAVCNWVDESFCCNTDFAFMEFNNKTNTITSSANADLKNAYIGFRSSSKDAYPVYCWIHFSLINLDTLIIHEAFATPYVGK